MNAWLAAIEAKLVYNWREFWKWTSTKLGIVGTLLTGWFVAFPESAVHAWLALPEDVRSLLPPQIVGYVGVGIFVLSMLAKLVKQRKLPSNQ